MANWSIGGVRISRIAERPVHSVPIGSFLPEVDLAALEKNRSWVGAGHYDFETQRVHTYFCTWLIRTGRRTILVDTCNGNHRERPGMVMSHMLDMPYLQNLREAGVQPEDVDFVMCTHMHPDHVGWNTRLDNGRWVPTFPNAKYVFSRAELAQLQADLERPGRPAWEKPMYADSILPILEGGRNWMVEGSEVIDEVLTIRPAPGHTAGLYRVDLDTKGEHAVFSGDLIHSLLQLLFPEANIGFDAEPLARAAQARKARLDMLRHCVEHNALLLPAHFGPPYADFVVPGPGGDGPTYLMRSQC